MKNLKNNTPPSINHPKLSQKGKEKALLYHSHPLPGKLETTSTKPLNTQKDLALAYSPGVAEACCEINHDPYAASLYTGKQNLVAVMTNGTAVLGLGDIGALASKPVMEGKAVLFKKFADLNAFDLEIDETDPDQFVRIAASLAPTFGGINLEDIKAPECFDIEEKLSQKLSIPVFHDDQHGTAIVVVAALLNGLELNHKPMHTIKLVVNGAGAAALACLKLLESYGLTKDQVWLFDSQGLVHKNRPDLSAQKQPYAQKGPCASLYEAMNGADAFLGLSKGGVLNCDMITPMAKAPLLFTLANPTPEIMPDAALEVRPDAITATGRSDFPNQINNLLCFPFIFRGALDVEARLINLEMKKAAVKAIASLAKTPPLPLLKEIYPHDTHAFGPHHILPKPFDPRLITHIAPAVAKAAMDTGVARHTIDDWEHYKQRLKERLKLTF